MYFLYTAEYGIELPLFTARQPALHHCEHLHPMAAYRDTEIFVYRIDADVMLENAVVV